MPTWVLSNLEKKNCVEREFWNHPDYSNPIIREIGWRWGSFSCSSTEKPEIDLENPDGLYVYDTDYDFEMDSLDDSCWEEWVWPEEIPQEERKRLEELWEEDFYDGWENDGISLDESEVVLHGPLSLEEART